MVICLSLASALVINFLLFLAVFGLSSHRTGASLVASIPVLIWALRLGCFRVLRIRKSGHDKRFDEIRSNYFKFLKFWLGQGFAAWLLLLPLLFILSHQSHWSWLFAVGIIIWVSMYVIALTDLPLFEQLIGLVSPVAMFVTLRFISGVPILSIKNTAITRHF